MKKWLVLLTTAFIIFSSCSSSSGFDNTIRKIAKLMCREKQLQRDIDNGNEKAKEELEKVKAEHEKLKNEVQEKYKKESQDDDMKVRAIDIHREVMAECH